MMKAPINSAAATLPGIPRAMVGIRLAPVTALLAASVAAMPSSLPVPNSSGDAEARFAAPYPRNPAIVTPRPGIMPTKVPM